MIAGKWRRTSAWAVVIPGSVSLQFSLPSGPRWRRSRGAVPHAADQRDLTERDVCLGRGREELEDQKQSKPAFPSTPDLSPHLFAVDIVLTCLVLLYSRSTVSQQYHTDNKDYYIDYSPISTLTTPTKTILEQQLHQPHSHVNLMLALT